MLRNFLRSKLHRAAVTQADLHYEGSISIDQELLELSEIAPFEVVDIYNIDNGERFTTYAIPAPAGSKTFGLNGAAARKAMVGDRIIVACFAQVTEEELRELRPKLILLDAENNVKEVLRGEILPTEVESIS